MPVQFLKKIKAIQWRLQWIEFCRKFLNLLTALSLLLFVYVLASRLVKMELTPEVTAPWIAIAAGVILLIWGWIKRVRIFDAALRADEALGLKERLSSAYLIRQPKTEAEIAVLEDAARCAEAIRPMRHFPAHLNREVKWALGPLAALIALWVFMPQYDLFATREQKKLEATQVKVEAKKEAAKELEELAKEIGETSDLKKSDAALSAEKEMKELAKLIKEQKVSKEEAMAKLAKTSDKIAERKGELENKLNKAGNMQGLGEGKMTRDISKALEKNNFEKAAQAMEQLKEKLKQGQLSEEEKNSLQKEMKAMAEKLGMESKMGQAAAKAAQNMAEGKTAEAMADMEQMASEMSDLEQAASEMESLDQLQDDIEARNRAMNGKPGNCESCGKETQEGEGKCSSCSEKASEWKPGDSREIGKGSGGPGIGQGSIVNKEEGDVAFEKKKIKGDLEAGRIIAKMKVNGEQKIGEITTEFEDLRMQYEQKAEDSIQNDMMPLEHKARIREYFDAIKEAKQETAEKNASDAPRPKPEPAKP